MRRVIDTHCHLCDKRFDKDREAMLQRAFESGVTHFIEIAYAPPIVDRAHALAARHPNVFLCVGVHPSEAAKVGDERVQIYKVRCFETPTSVATYQVD